MRGAGSRAIPTATRAGARAPGRCLRAAPAPSRAPRRASRARRQSSARCARAVTRVTLEVRGAPERRVGRHVLAPVEARLAERGRDEFLEAREPSRRDHVIRRRVLLEHAPHRLDVLGRPAPVALHVHVAEHELLAVAGGDARRGERDLLRDEALGPERRLVVEEDAVAGVQAVAVAVVGDHEVRGRPSPPRTGCAGGTASPRRPRRHGRAEALARPRVVEARRQPQEADHLEQRDRGIHDAVQRVDRLRETTAPPSSGPTGCRSRPGGASRAPPRRCGKSVGLMDSSATRSRMPRRARLSKRAMCTSREVPVTS